MWSKEIKYLYYISDMISTNDGGIAVVSMGSDTFTITSHFNISITKLDANGNYLWQRRFNPDKIHFPFGINTNSIIQNPDSGFLVLGGFPDSANYNQSLLLIRTDKFGDTLWTKIIFTTPEDGPLKLIRTIDSGMAILYRYCYNCGFPGIGLIKLDQNYNVKWVNTYIDSLHSIPSNFTETSAGDLIVLSNLSLGWNSNITLTKIDSGGKLKKHGTVAVGSFSEFGSSIIAEANTIAFTFGIDFDYTMASFIGITKTDTSFSSLCNWNDIPCTTTSIPLSFTNNFIKVDTGGPVNNFSLNLFSSGGSVTNLCIESDINETTQASMKMFPNPTAGKFNIDLNQFCENVTMEIISLTGQVISIKNYADVQTVNSEIEGVAGIYFINIIIPHERKISLKIIKT